MSEFKSYKESEYKDRNNKKRGSSNRNRNFSRDRSRNDRGRSSERPTEMTTVICSSCKKECKVPFKPRTNKPLFCNDCFNKGETGSNSKQSAELKIISDKLDKILSLLENR